MTTVKWNQFRIDLNSKIKIVKQQTQEKIRKNQKNGAQIHAALKLMCKYIQSANIYMAQQINMLAEK